MSAEKISNSGQSAADSSPAQRLSLLGRLAAFLSHEIRNPLNAIFLHLDIVEEELHRTAPEDRVQIDRSLATVRGEVGRLYDLMQDYLSLARLSDAARELEDVRMFLESVVREVRESLAAEGIFLQLEGIESLGQVAMHKPTLHGAFLHMVQAAASSLPQGGHLTLRSSRTPSHLHVALHHADKPGQTQAGPQPLLGAQRRTSEEAHLKLSVVQEIVSAHGGSFKVCDPSDPSEEGPTYMVILPLSASVHPKTQ